MENRIEIIELIDEYKSSFPDEEKRTEPIMTFLNNFEGSQLFDRKNFVGHITASAYIINQSKNSLLLLEHKFLKRWLQPGGHVDPFDTSLTNAALREAVEETGMKAGMLFPVSDSILDIDSHPIPENTSKYEPAHFHHDISFLFVSADINPIHFNRGESTGGKWVTFEQLIMSESEQRIIEKIKKITSY